MIKYAWQGYKENKTSGYNKASLSVWRGYVDSQLLSIGVTDKLGTHYPMNIIWIIFLKYILCATITLTHTFMLIHL